MHSAQVVAFPGRAERAEPEWSVLFDGATVEGSGRHIIKNISCRMSPHGITAIMGANGAGKSTLLKVVAGLSRLTADMFRSIRNSRANAPWSSRNRSS